MCWVARVTLTCLYVASLRLHPRSELLFRKRKESHLNTQKYRDGKEHAMFRWHRQSWGSSTATSSLCRKSLALHYRDDHVTTITENITEALFCVRCFPFYLQSSEKLCGLFYRWGSWRSEWVSDCPKATQQEADRTKIQVLLPSLAPSSTVLPLHKHRAFEHSSLTRPLYFLKHFKRKKEKQNPVVTLKSRENHRESRDDFCTFMAEWTCRSYLFSLASNFSGCHMSSLGSTRRTEENRTENNSFVCNDRNSGDPRIHPPLKKRCPLWLFFSPLNFKSIGLSQQLNNQVRVAIHESELTKDMLCPKANQAMT